MFVKKSVPQIIIHNKDACKEYELSFVSLKHNVVNVIVQADDIHKAMDSIANYYLSGGNVKNICMSLDDILNNLNRDETICSFVKKHDLVICGDVDVFLICPTYVTEKEIEKIADVIEEFECNF